MLEFWKRKEKRIALEWGMSGFEIGTSLLTRLELSLSPLLANDAIAAQ